MGCLVDSGILNPDKTLTATAKQNFIQEVKELVIYGSNGLPNPLPFTCGDPLPPNSDLRIEDYDLENEEKWASFHRDIIKNKYEKFAASLDVESAQSLLPIIADPIALAGKFGIELPELPFPDGYIPYFSGLLLPKFVLDLLKADIPDYFLPPLLAAKLPEFISLPSPPSITPLIPTFAPPFPGVPNIPSPNLPSIPALGLADLVAVDIALAEQIPKLLADLIGEMPKLLLKLPDIGSVFSDLCKKIRDSGVFGKTEPHETVKQAIDTVLSRKLMACIFLAAVGSTVGVSPGSMGPAISKEILKESPPPKPPQTPASTTRPVDLVARRARSLGSGEGISYGNNGSAYVNSLFYYEAASATYGEGKVSAYGFPVLDARLPPRTLPTNAIVNMLKGRADGPNYSAVRDYSDDGPNSYGVESPRGLLEYADRGARFYSSCAIFARACLYAGGAKNFYFLCQYPPSTAIDALRGLAIIKNYRWLLDDGSVNKELVSFADALEAQNRGGAFSSLIDPWDLDKNGNSNSSEINKFLLRGSEKVTYHVDELSGMAERGEPFPALEAGDVILVKNRGKDDAHIMVINASRPATQFIPKGNSKDFTYIDPPIVGIEGGQIDFQNVGNPSDVKGGESGETPSAEAPKERPTAIRAGSYDLGYVDRGKNTPGYYVGKTRTSNAGGVALEAQSNWAVKFRRVELIIKTNNFLKIDALDTDAAFEALAVIDASPAMKFVEKSLSDPDRLAMMVETLYPSYPRPPRKK